MMNVTSDTSTVFGGCDGENKKDNSNQLFSDAKLYQPKYRVLARVPGPCNYWLYAMDHCNYWKRYHVDPVGNQHQTHADLQLYY